MTMMIMMMVTITMTNNYIDGDYDVADVDGKILITAMVTMMAVRVQNSCFCEPLGMFAYDRVALYSPVLQ